MATKKAKKSAKKKLGRKAMKKTKGGVSAGAPGPFPYNRAGGPGRLEIMKSTHDV